ncbi:uncharacterized protein EI97DRAFT_449929 [Westerdykella ornata]|uniref:Protein BNI4 n=1 Tax=Westerdykella ornata TaxID=318751 RepID=A0A6A6JLV5_WESOR|nr:uncharacterized protein EI97DRAFT_449929 [Westerdykella ornata]KAF2277215.1 hypothetical protein EI97DRAFT_449929 [Westerdykella ornata]
MAQVLAPIVQTSGTITMLHTSPDAFQSPPAAAQPHPTRTSQMSRTQVYNAQNGGTAYRGTAAPIAPYAFSSTPQLRQEGKSTSAPNLHSLQQMNPARQSHPTHTSSSSDSTVSTSGSSSRSAATAQVTVNDDSAISTNARKSVIGGLPASAMNLSSSIPDLPLAAAALDAPVKPSPDRYRRAARRTDSSGAATSSAPTTPQPSPSIGGPVASGGSPSSNATSMVPAILDNAVRPGHNRASSVDDMQGTRQTTLEQAKRYRRRSHGGFDATPQFVSPPALNQISSTIVASPSSVKPSPAESHPGPSSGGPTSRPDPGHNHERQLSSGSVSSTGSSRPSSVSPASESNDGMLIFVQSRQTSNSSQTRVAPGVSSPSAARGTPETTKRVIAPSPLSNPISPSEPPSPAKPTAPASPAVQQLVALNDKDSSRGMKSRLRRAFSFGSAAELRRATAENNLSAERVKLRKDRHQNEHDAEEAAIVAKQEAAGIGAGIYNGQGGFTGSTDNLSISSTASSASIMLRKMGNGMRKGGRSIKGLFRPKSVIGVPAADGPLMRPSAAEVSMVTVEAERQKVNVNADPHDQVGGGTGYPRLERNSLDAGRAGSDAGNESSRKSIVGGDRERAEVLSSIKKGILKRAGTGSNSSSPVSRPADALSETPKSSAPSTPNDDQGRQIQVHISGEDYFGKPRFPNHSTRSLPNTPHTRTITFSPKVQCHEAWSSADYDRRGDIATCNRLTPMLAQQIKEELNSFKMEMEVHELSKPHTHFF